MEKLSPQFITEQRAYPPSPEDKVTWEDLDELKDWDIIVLDQFAGFGHLRFSIDFMDGAKKMGCPDSQLNHLVVQELLGSRVHSKGSNNPIFKKLTEIWARSLTFQRLLGSTYHHTIINSDQEIVREALRKEIIARKSKKVVIVLSHPDLATVMNDSKAELEKELGVEIFSVILMPDHLQLRPQFPYYTHNADLLIAPDEGSALIAHRELTRWWKINNFFRRFVRPLQPMNVPRVEVVPHSVHPSLREVISHAMLQDRLDQANPNTDTKLKLFIPMGGSSPGQATISAVIKNLDGKIEPHVLVKKHESTETFAQQLSESGTSVEQHPKNIENIEAFNRTFRTLNPAVVMPKPGELVNLTQLLTTQMGGAVMVLLEAVGDQEKQNLAWVRQHVKMPDEVDQRALEDALIRGHEKHMSLLRAKAINWRAISIPQKKLFETTTRHAKRIAKFLKAALEQRIFQTMMAYESSETPRWETRDDGDALLWWTINQALLQHRERKSLESS